MWQVTVDGMHLVNSVFMQVLVNGKSKQLVTEKIHQLTMVRVKVLMTSCLPTFSEGKPHILKRFGEDPNSKVSNYRQHVQTFFGGQPTRHLKHTFFLLVLHTTPDSLRLDNWGS